MADIKPPRRVTGSLGDNQLAWCRAHIRGFEVMERQAREAREATEASRKRDAT